MHDHHVVRLVAAAVAGVAVLLSACTAHAHSAPAPSHSAAPSRSAAAPATTDRGTAPRELLGHRWRLVSVARSGQSGSARAAGKIWIRFARKSDLPRSAHWATWNEFCASATANISPTQIDFRQLWSSLSDSCGPVGESKAEMAQENLVFDRILTGRTEWSIDNGRLTISNPKYGSVVFRSEPLH